jgi:hypothetical protein
MTMESIRRRNDDTFWQKLVLPEEERRWIRDWKGGYRWFRSPDVICLERYRTIRHGEKPALLTTSGRRW